MSAYIANRADPITAEAGCVPAEKQIFTPRTGNLTLLWAPPVPYEDRTDVA